MSPANKYGVIQSLPKEKRGNIWNELVTKSGGVCQLCEDPLGDDNLVIEHKDNSGPDEVHNLYLAHPGCNSVKKDLPYDDAKRKIKFRKFSESKPQLDFDNILDKYCDVNRKSTMLTIDDGEVTLEFSPEHSVKTKLMTDPTTGTNYCFAEVPVKCLNNDKEVQPRLIEFGHVWVMLENFKTLPVHEPSSVRFQRDDSQVGKLLLWDGQHKTTAQILLGRETVQTKIYIEPEVTLIKELVLATQNRITKKRLAPAIHLRKMDSVYKEKLASSGASSEEVFVNSYSFRDRRQAKQEIYASVYQNIYDDSNNRITKHIQPGGTRSGASYPLSVNLFRKSILKYLVCPQLQKVALLSPDDHRTDEAGNVVFILNILADELLEKGKWVSRGGDQKTSTDHRKAVRFFKSGSVKWWGPKLQAAIENRLNLVDDDARTQFLCRFVDDVNKDLIKTVVLRLANHPIWTDSDEDIDIKLNENKTETSKALFRGYNKPGRLDTAYLLDLPDQ